MARRAVSSEHIRDNNISQRKLDKDHDYYIKDMSQPTHCQLVLN